MQKVMQCIAIQVRERERNKWIMNIDGFVDPARKDNYKF